MYKYKMKCTKLVFVIGIAPSLQLPWSRESNVNFLSYYGEYFIYLCQSSLLQAMLLSIPAEHSALLDGQINL
nr:hypothetical protein Iba_chr01dCG16970 [Ipomoea batatas]GMC56363.1 hypothetical protein Iba_chr01fCG6350 [Ipomoea batatas]